MKFLSHQAFFDHVRLLVDALCPYDGLDGCVCTAIAAQICLESDFGRSDLAIGQNNYSGMKTPKKRFAFGCVEPSNNFQRYQSLRECIADLWVWLEYRGFSVQDVVCAAEYVDFLYRGGYCPESDYGDKILKIYKQYKN